ncbi:hypothetical protein R1flu_017377 [Riccia fluitans]|uniref:Uncharacterized protein n=1 Tax=Riccia fluitans TaxID=41844 RepID=A0ABD1ZGT5_9MARC
MVYHMFVNQFLDVTVYVGGDHYSQMKLNAKNMDVAKSILALGSNLNYKPMKEVIINFVHKNPNFNKFEEEAVKDTIHTGVFGFLGSIASKYIPHQNLGVPTLQAKKDKAVKEAEHLRKGKEKAPNECKKKKEARDRELDDIPLPSLTTKHKQFTLGWNVLSRDGSQNAEPAEESLMDAPTSSLRKKIAAKLTTFKQLGKSHAHEKKIVLCNKIVECCRISAKPIVYPLSRFMNQS